MGCPFPRWWRLGGGGGEGGGWGGGWGGVSGGGLRGGGGGGGGGGSDATAVDASKAAETRKEEVPATTQVVGEEKGQPAGGGSSGSNGSNGDLAGGDLHGAASGAAEEAAQVRGESLVNEAAGSDEALATMTATRILYHEAYPDRLFISLVDMLAVMPDIEIGACDISGQSLEGCEPGRVFVCPETAEFVKQDWAMRGAEGSAAVIASTKSKQIELSGEILFAGGRSQLLDVSHGILKQMVCVTYV